TITKKVKELDTLHSDIKKKLLQAKFKVNVTEKKLKKEKAVRIIANSLNEQSEKMHLKAFNKRVYEVNFEKKPLGNEENQSPVAKDTGLLINFQDKRIDVDLNKTSTPSSLPVNLALSTNANMSPSLSEAPLAHNQSSSYPSNNNGNLEDQLKDLTLEDSDEETTLKVSWQTQEGEEVKIELFKTGDKIDLSFLGTIDKAVLEKDILPQLKSYLTEKGFKLGNLIHSKGS
ncbi:MAG: hypothetical protein D6780_06605, partial [Candidatus Dadabacteria bacterium]